MTESPLHNNSGFEISSDIYDKSLNTKTQYINQDNNAKNNVNNSNNQDDYDEHITINLRPSAIWSIKWILKDEKGLVRINNSDASTILLLLNSMIGSGILVQAYVFKKGGIIVVFFEYIVLTIMNYAGVEALVACGFRKQIFDYPKLVESIFGEYGSIAVDSSIVISGYGSLLSYVLIIGSLFKEVTGSSCSAGYCSVVFLTIIPITLFTVPLCLLRNFAHLAVASYISIFVIGSIMLLVIIGGPIHNVSDNTGTNYNLGNFLGSLTTIGDIVFSLGYIPAVFHAYSGNEDKTQKKIEELTLFTTITGSIMCFITGFIGYLSFVNNTKTNILSNFSGSVGAVFKLFLILHLILFIPGDFVITRAAFLRLFKLEVKDLSDITYITLTLLIIYTITFNAIMLQVFASNNDNLGSVINLTGGTAGSMLSFIIPGLCCIKLFSKDTFLYYKNFALVLFGVIIFILVIITTALG